MRLILFFAIALSVLESRARADFGSYFQEQVEHADDSLTLFGADRSEPVDWELTKIFLNVSPDASLGIPGVAKLTVTPEIEFVWARE